MKTRQLYIFIFGIGLLLIASVGCDTAPIIDPPLPPAPVPDCSYAHTVMAVDTNEYPPPNTGQLETQYEFYEEYELIDIGFNPNDPNQLVAGIYLYAPGGGTIRTILLVIDLCTGEENIIYTSEGTDKMRCLDWGPDNRIVFVEPNPPHSVFVIDADGNNLVGTEVPYPFGDAKNIRWAPDGESFLVHQIPKISQFSVSGQLLTDDIGFTAQDFVYLPDGRIGYINYFEIGVFDPESGSSLTIEQLASISAEYDISYSPLQSALLWSIDTMVAITPIETGQHTVLSIREGGWKWFKTTATSKNGYLAYIVEVNSLALSTPGVWRQRTELRFINADGTDERRLVLDFE